MSERLTIGHVVATERKPNTAYTFNFWAEQKAKVGIGSLVKVEAVSPDGEVQRVFGTVIGALGFNDLESALHEVMLVGGDGTLPPTSRPEVRLFEAAVLRREPEEPIGAVPIGFVSLATEKEVSIALRTESYKDTFGIAAGCYGSMDELAAVHLDRRFLLGPEAGHMNVTGTSGLAAKTSYILTVIQSVFNQASAQNDAGSVAALLFNTKGGDLLYLDQPPLSDDLSPADQEIYRRMGYKAGPFAKVRYYAPFTSSFIELNTLRRNNELDEINPSLPYCFGLDQVLDNMAILLGKGDLDARADGYLQFLIRQYVQQEGLIDPSDPGGERRRAYKLTDICEIAKQHLQIATTKNLQNFASHHTLTISKMYRYLSNLDFRFKGLVAPDGQSLGPLQDKFENGTLYVIDVAKLTLEEQNLVFATFMTGLQALMERHDLGVDHLIVVVDELNKYVPTGGTETPISRAMVEIAARGRYMGLTLFGAQQFRSRVDREVVGNSATHVFGHVEAEELAQPGYSYFSPAIKEKLATLETGQVLVKHPYFSQPIFLRFPRPYIMKGGEGLKRYRQSDDRSFGDVVLEHVERIEPTARPAVQRLLDTLSPAPDEQYRVLRSLAGMRQGEDPRLAFKGTKIAAAVISQRPDVLPRAELDPEEDPFARA